MECFWFIVAIGCLAWYSTVTVYVAYKGIFDIKEMLENLKEDHRKGEVHK
jgi:hypothetical protein